MEIRGIFCDRGVLPREFTPNSSGAAGGSLHGRASFKVEKAFLLHGRVRRTAKMKSNCVPLLCGAPLSENSRRLWLSEIRCWKSFPANFDAAGKLFPDVPAARNAIPAKVRAFSGKENGCWKIGPAFGNAAGFSPPRPPQP